jgi:GNAT superfamily N-acetyltransferase
MSEMNVRRRTEADLDECVHIALAVYELDRYPVTMPSDLRGFLVWPGAYGAWVAEQSGQIVGHVALHPRSSPPVLELAAQALGQPIEKLAVVARLYVAPWARRAGVAQTLLEVAADEAVSRGLWPVLDVATTLGAAIRLYDACRWTCAGEVTVYLDDGMAIDELVYLGPRRPGDNPT